MLNIKISFIYVFLFLFCNAVYAIPVQSNSIKLNQLKINHGIGSYTSNGKIIRSLGGNIYKGKTVFIKNISQKLKFKYIKTIRFNRNGYPDFSNYSKQNIKTLKLTGNHKIDVKTVEKILKQRNPKWKKRVGYTWHYHQDGKTMQYIPIDLHTEIAHKNLKFTRKPSGIYEKKKIYTRVGVYRKKLYRGKYAGEEKPIKDIAPKLSGKYKGTIIFDKNGYPDFRPYSIEDVKTKRLTGNRQRDVRIVEKILKQRNPRWKKRNGYSWHHHQDGKTMQLVPTDLHSAIPHRGGVSILKQQNKNK